ncbi:hypothetical protein AB4865_06980 [Capnocytophaga sp. ARDL2]|uniref:hypothetical protein n=1 Tax=Capnocytophaga sp. ARDL2 TaxID=3238809 RepID=UPI00355656D6
MKKIILFLIFNVFISCKSSIQETKTTKIVTIIGSEFYEIKFNNLGKAVAIKGEIYFFNDLSFHKEVRDSINFNIIKTSKYFKLLKEYEKKPYYSEQLNNEFNVKIYCEDIKVFDSYRFDSFFWKLIKSIGDQIPKEYNSFIHSD